MGNHHSSKRTESTKCTTESRERMLLCKVAIIGPDGSGNTSVSIRFQGKVDYDLNLVQSTIGATWGTRRLYLDDTMMKLEMWDVAGNERYIGLLPIYTRGACGIVLVYDVTNRQDFDRAVSFWLETATKNASPNVTVMVLANKCELTRAREVSYDDGRSLADGNDFLYFEVSAKDMTNIELALATFAARIKEKYDNRSKSSD